MDRPARGRASTGAYRLSGRVAVRRHRLPALHLHDAGARNRPHHLLPPPRAGGGVAAADRSPGASPAAPSDGAGHPLTPPWHFFPTGGTIESRNHRRRPNADTPCPRVSSMRSEEHTSELQSLMRISYAVFCLKKKKTSTNIYKTIMTITST